MFGRLTRVLFFPCSLFLCTWTEDEGLTFLPWLAEGQYYRKRWQSCPILKQWGLIFLKSLVIVFDKSIWEAFRERIRDAPWPTFLSSASSLLYPPHHHHRYWTRVLIKRASKTGAATFSAPHHHHRTVLSLSRHHHDHPIIPPLPGCLSLHLSLLFSNLSSSSCSPSSPVSLHTKRSWC